MQTPTKRDVMDLHKAVKVGPRELFNSPKFMFLRLWHFQGLGTDERVLIEILASRTNEEIQAIRYAFLLVHAASKQKINTFLQEHLLYNLRSAFRRRGLVRHFGRFSSSSADPHSGKSRREWYWGVSQSGTGQFCSDFSEIRRSCGTC